MKLVEAVTNSAWPLMVPERTPPQRPPSSPVLLEKMESRVQTGWPLTLTVVAVCAASTDLATLV
jgi:hypothetical protein